MANLVPQDTTMVPAPRDQRPNVQYLLHTLEDTFVHFRGNNILFKSMNPIQRYQYIQQRKMILTDIEDKNATNLRILAQQEEAAKGPDGEISMEQAQHFATIRGELQRMIAGTIEQADIHWDYNALSAMSSTLAEHAATELEARSNETLDLGFQVKFVECLLTELTKEGRHQILDTLQRNFGSLDVNSVNLNLKFKELYATFYTAEAKNRCIEAGKDARHPEWGTPTGVLTPAILDVLHSLFTLFVEPLMEGTTESQVKTAFNEQNADPTSVRLYRNIAFVNYDTEEDLNNALKIQRIKVNNRKLNIVAARQCDPDELKGILGFWDGRTTPLNALYLALTAHSWNFLYLQPVFWDNGKLKHYYFIRFATVADKEAAMLTPAKVEGNVLQVYPIVRDEAGRLSFPAEGAWKKRRVGNAQVQTSVQSGAAPPAQYVPIVMRTFD